MTHVEISKKYIEVKGHSGYASAGSDIICSAISTLTEATYNYLEATENNVRYEASDGYFIIYFEELNVYGKNIIDAYGEMIDELISQYPKYIERRKSNEKAR